MEDDSKISDIIREPRSTCSPLRVLGIKDIANRHLATVWKTILATTKQKQIAGPMRIWTVRRESDFKYVVA
jgi:hypothetical protein